MSSKQLMEAAAEILSGSKTKAGAMPMEKLSGSETVDLGGPTPQNSKPMDDSNKIDATKAAKKATAPTTKPSAASSDTQNKVQGGTKTMGEEEEFDDYITEDELDEFMQTEEFEQLDELSKATLRSYKAKAEADADSRYQKDASLGRSAGALKQLKAKTNTQNIRSYSGLGQTGSNLAKHHPDLHKKLGHIYDTLQARRKEDMKKYDLRNQGIERAEDRLSKKSKKITKEEFFEEVFNFSFDIDSLFEGNDNLSEEFKTKASTIFEARVYDRVAQIQEQLETEYADMLEEAVENIYEELTEKIDEYMTYVIEQWMEDNEIAIESSLRSELTEDFINGLRNLFAENYIDIPEEKVDLVDELAERVQELEEKLNEEIDRGVTLANALIESRRNEIAIEVCEGLTATQVEKIKSLAESVEFSSEENFKEKLETIRENYFPSGVKKAAEDQLHEWVEDDAKKVTNDPFIAAVSKAISKTKI
jgi:hypothetical protein